MSSELPKHEYQVLIREGHLDTFGHMNNARYLDLYEEARWDWITSNGYGLDKIKSQGQGPVILKVELSFLKEIKWREQISIVSELVSYQSKTGILRQRMIKPGGELASEASFVFALFDLRERKIIKATPEWLRGLGVS